MENLKGPGNDRQRSPYEKLDTLGDALDDWTKKLDEAIRDMVF